jgi:hypothetical protein
MQWLAFETALLTGLSAPTRGARLGSQSPFPAGESMVEKGAKRAEKMSPIGVTGPAAGEVG